MAIGGRTEPPAALDEAIDARKRVMGLCADATPAELSSALDLLAPLPAATDLRPPETGLVMLRGRMGGDGRAFNLGEATVTRAAVRLATGEVGHAYQLGRDRPKARVSATLDALVQCGRAGDVMAALDASAGRAARERALAAARAAATRVEFFTLTRGED